MTYSKAEKLIKSKFKGRVMLRRNDVVEITNLTLNDLSNFMKTGSGLNYIKNDGKNGAILYPIIEVSRYLSDPSTIGNEIRKKDMINLILEIHDNKLEFRRKDISKMLNISENTIQRQIKTGLSPKNKYRRKDRKVIYDVDTLGKWMTNFIKTSANE